MRSSLFEVPRDGRLVLRAGLSAAAVICIYAVHWFLAAAASTVLGAGEGDFECWGRTNSGYCTAAWGGWSIAMYLPELALLTAAIAGLASRSFRVWKVGLGSAAVSLWIFFVVVLSTQLFAINQMPVFWPPFR
jgi:hypothetical protein